MDKKRHKTFVKFITDHAPFREGEIGIIVKGHRSWAQWDNKAGGRIEDRGAKIRSINGQKEGEAWEVEHYIRIETTPALEILYGKYHEPPPTIIKEEELHGKGYDNYNTTKT